MIENCVKCEGKMIAGTFVDRSQTNQLIWIEGELETSLWSVLKVSDKEAFSVQTFRCANCGYLEFYTTDRIYL